MQYEYGNRLFEGYQAFWPKQALAVTIDDHKVRFLGHDRYITGHGVGGTMLTLTVTSPAPEVIRVQAAHHIGQTEKGRAFRLSLDENSPIDAEETADTIVIRSGKLTLTITKDPFTMTFSSEGKMLAKSREQDLALVKSGWTGNMYDKPDNSLMSEHLSLSVDEQIYGLGERFGPFVKNGQKVIIRNDDGGTGSSLSYKNVPFYLSSRGYGVFVNHAEPVEFDVGCDRVSRVGFAVKGESLDYFFFNGPDLKDVLRRYTDLTGKPALPPQWSFGLWLSTSFTTSYDSRTVLSFIDGMQSRGIPLSVFHFDCCWMRDFHWTDFLWDNRVFEDPEGLIAQIHQKGVRVCVWIDSSISQESILFREGMANGYFVKRKDGSVWQNDNWQSGRTFVDFTNPAAARWFADHLKELLRMGVDCFKSDGGDWVPLEDACWYDGTDPERMRNLYSLLYTGTVFEAVREVKGEENALIYARSATAGCQQYPVHWGGDCPADYDGMLQSIRGGLSFTASGFGFWAHDIGGFEDTSTPDVYKRWLAFGLLSTHSRLHGCSSYRVPWNYDEESVAVCRFFTRLKLSLLPYLYSAAVETHLTGIPMMRAMVIDYPQDPACRYLDRQYMLGGSLLAAPVFNEDGLAKWYLPEENGPWTAFLTGEEKAGGKWYTEKVSYLDVPLYVKPNSIIPTAVEAPDADVRFRENVEFRVFRLQDEASCAVYQDGRELYHLRLVREGNRVRIDTDAKGCRIRFVNETTLDVPGFACCPEGRDLIVRL